MLAGPAQGVAPDSLRRALGDVFARPEYRWVQGRTLWQWLLELWYRVLDWLGTLQTAHPGGYRMLMVALMEIGRASCRERGWISVVGVRLHRKWEGGQSRGESL